jgi:transcriptional regulator with XRE-family HTH domain
MTTKIDIKALRVARQWTQDEMAAHFGVDKATVWRWENVGIPQRGASRKALEREFKLVSEAEASP